MGYPETRKRENRFLLVDLPGPSKGLHYSFAILSTMLLRQGCDVRVLDLNNANLAYPIGTYGMLAKDLIYRINYVDVAKEINAFRPDIVITTVNNLRLNLILQEAKDFIAFLKKEYPSITVVIEGPQLALDAKRIMEETYADIGIIGEGDYTVQDLAMYFAGMRSLESIQGIAYRQNNRVVETARRPFITDLDSLPFPNYEYFTTVIACHNTIHTYPIAGSRGCPHHCIFCADTVIEGKKWRSRSVENVLAEIRYAKQRHNIQGVMFAEINPWADINRAKKLLESIIDEKLNLVISAIGGVRADSVDRELLQLFKRAGGKCVYVGIETGEPQVFSRVNKGETLAQIEKTIQAAHEAGLTTDGTFIIGLPGSSFEKDLYSIKFAKKLGLDHTWFSLATAFPNTEMFAWVKEHGHILHDYTEAEISHLKKGWVNFETADYREKKRLNALHQALVATRDFSRLGYQLSGIPKYLQISALCLRYDVKTFFVYQASIFKEWLYNLLTKSGLYPLARRLKHWIIKPRIAPAGN